MKKDIFFKPTATYKEFLILVAVEENPQITQRELAAITSSSVSMINQYLDEYERKGYIKKKHVTTKNVQYNITGLGKERKQVLNIGYLNEIQRNYQIAKKETKAFLTKIVTQGYRNVIFYGAGDVAEILLQTIKDDQSIPINVVGLIDDNVDKQGVKLVDIMIESNDIIKNVHHDAVMVTSYTKNYEIYSKLRNLKYPKDKIINFFKQGESI